MKLYLIACNLTGNYSSFPVNKSRKYVVGGRNSDLRKFMGMFEKLSL